MINYDVITINEGGPWIGSIAIPAILSGNALSIGTIKAHILSEHERLSAVLTGGDPLLHPDIEDVIRTVSQNKYRNIMMRTTDTQLRDISCLERIFSCGVNKCEIIPALPFGSQKISRKSIAEGIKGLRTLRRLCDIVNERYNLLYIGLMIPVTSLNYSNLPEIVHRITDSVNVNRVIFCWGEPSFPIWQASLYIREGIQLCIKRDIWAVTRGIPMCAMPQNIHHFEELFNSDVTQKKLPLPAACAGCCFKQLCSCMPAVDTSYTWDVKPFTTHAYAPYINDIIEKGYVFDDTNAELYAAD